MECLYCRAPLSVEASERGQAYCGDEHEQLKAIEERLGIGSNAGRPGPSAAPVARAPGLFTIGSPPGPAVGSAQDSELTAREALLRLDRAVSETRVQLPTAGSEENTQTPHKNVCQVCAKPIPFPMRLVGSEFCSVKHKREAERQKTEQLLERLQSDEGNLGDGARFPNTGRVVRIRPPASNENWREASPERSVASLGTVSAEEAWRFIEAPIPIPLPLSASRSAFGNSAEFRGVAPREQVLREPGIPGADSPARPPTDWVLLWLPTVPPALASRQSITILGLEQGRLAFLQQAPVQTASWIATTVGLIEGRVRPSIPAPGPSAVSTRLPGRLSIWMQPWLKVAAGSHGAPHFSDSWNDTGFPAQPRMAQSRTPAIRFVAPRSGRPPMLSRPNAVKPTPRIAGGGAWTSHATPPSNPRLCQHQFFPAAMPRCGEIIGIGAPAAPGAAPQARHRFLEEPSLPPRMPCWHAASPATWSFSTAAAKEIHWHRAAAGITAAVRSSTCWNGESRRAPWMAKPEPATELAVAPPAGGRPVVLSQPSPMRATGRIRSLNDLTFHEGTPSVLTTLADLYIVRRQHTKTLSPVARPGDRIGLPRICHSRVSQAVPSSFHQAPALPLGCPSHGLAVQPATAPLAGWDFRMNLRQSAVAASGACGAAAGSAPATPWTAIPGWDRHTLSLHPAGPIPEERRDPAGSGMATVRAVAPCELPLAAALFAPPDSFGTPWPWNSRQSSRAESVLQPDYPPGPSQNAVPPPVWRADTDLAVRIPDLIRLVPITPAPETWWWAHRGNGLSTYAHTRNDCEPLATLGLHRRPALTLAIRPESHPGLRPVQSPPQRLRIPAMRIRHSAGSNARDVCE
jgi:hypothetical protein